MKNLTVYQNVFENLKGETNAHWNILLKNKDKKQAWRDLI